MRNFDVPLARVLAAIAGLVAFLGVWTLWNGFSWLTILEAALFRPFLTWIVPLLLTIVVVGFTMYAFTELDMGITAIAGTLAAVLIAAGIGCQLRLSYGRHSDYMEHVALVQTQTSYEDRAPWVVAEALASRSQGDEVGERGAIHHVPAPGNAASRYSVIIDGKDLLRNTGYVGVREYNLSKVGATSTSAEATCTFPTERGMREDSFWFTRSLQRYLHLRHPFTHYDADDMYGYCDHGSPIIVMPLWKYQGWITVTKAADGAVVYDAAGPHIYSPEELVAHKIEGPTMPRSLASTYLDALDGMGSFSDFMSDRGGYDTTTKDSHDANEGNAVLLSLVDTNGALSWVTPLTPRGSSQSLTAILVYPAQQGTANGVRIETSVNLPATSTLENTIRQTSVAGDSEWVARWAAGMKVYEVVPTKDGHWVASVGLGQVVNYRVDITPDGQVTVARLDAQAAPATPSIPAPGAPSATASNGKALADMSPQELRELIANAASELERRSK